VGLRSAKWSLTERSFVAAADELHIKRLVIEELQVERTIDGPADTRPEPVTTTAPPPI
jgi:hypothetical protein